MSTRIWEKIDSDTSRMKVHSGWVVKVERGISYMAGGAIALTFVPDPEHLWVLETDKL